MIFTKNFVDITLKIHENFTSQKQYNKILIMKISDFKNCFFIITFANNDSIMSITLIQLHEILSYFQEDKKRYSKHLQITIFNYEIFEKYYNLYIILGSYYIITIKKSNLSYRTLKVFQNDQLYFFEFHSLITLIIFALNNKKVYKVVKNFSFS